VPVFKKVLSSQYGREVDELNHSINSVSGALESNAISQLSLSVIWIRKINFHYWLQRERGRIGGSGEETDASLRRETETKLNLGSQYTYIINCLTVYYFDRKLELIFILVFVNHFNTNLHTS
jgi:hypothetical protein